MKKQFSLFGLLAMCLLLSFSACKDDEDTGPSIEELQKLREEQAAQIEARLTADGLSYEKDQFGIYQVAITANEEGEALQQGEVAEVYYTITQFDGTLIDQNTSGAPTRLTYSQGRSYLPYMFYPALTALRTGEKYRFYTPFVYGYNDIQVEGLIPLRGIVVMEVELLNIIRNVPELLAAEKVDFENYLQENSLTVTDTLAGDTLRGDVLKILQTPGEGETPADGQKVTVDYVGKLLNGEEFDAGSIDVTLGSGGVIPGFEMAVRSMKKGEAATFLLPSRQAYGDGVNNWFPLEELVGSPIAAHAPLVFEITVKEIQ